MIGDGTEPPAPRRDPELSYRSTTYPGACLLPHTWLQQDTERVSTLDLAGGGRFTLLTGTGGEPW